MGFGEILAAGTSAVVAFTGADASADEAKKAREQAAKLSKEALEFAREVYAEFQPVIQQTTDFFTNTTIDDLVSGRVLTPGAAAATVSFNRASKDVERRIKENLAKRGIANSTAGASVLAEFGVARARGVADIAGQGVERDINRRIALTQLGVSTSRTPIEAGLTTSGRLLSESSQLRGEAGVQAFAAGTSLADFIQEAGGLFKKKTQTRPISAVV